MREGYVTGGGEERRIRNRRRLREERIERGGKNGVKWEHCAQILFMSLQNIL